MRRLRGTIIRSQQIGWIAVLLLLAPVLTLLAGTHTDRITGAPVNNFFNAHTLMQMATDASAFASVA